jgi:hypothetical protein
MLPTQTPTNKQRYTTGSGYGRRYYMFKYVNNISNLLSEHGWKQVVQSRRQRGDFGKLWIHHPAHQLLTYLGDPEDRRKLR